MQNTAAQKWKLSKTSKQARLCRGAEASWHCRKVQKTSVAALVDNIHTSGRKKFEVLLDQSTLDPEVLLTLQETEVGMDRISWGML